MKVAFLIERFDPARGGMETSAKEFLSEVVPLDVEAHVVTQSAGGDFPFLKVHALGAGGLGRAGRYRHFVETAQSFVATGKWDVVHAITPCVGCDLYQPRAGVEKEAMARMVAARKNPLAKMFRQFGDRLNAKKQFMARLERELLTGQQLPMVAALSSYMRRQLEAAYAIPPERMREVFNGVTLPLPDEAERTAIRERLRRELDLATNERVVLFAGHNFRRKGLERLLDALALPEAHGWRLIVAGKDSRGPYERHTTRLGLSERVKFLGARKDIKQLYLAADACALPTYYDPCSRVILEALSVGVPSITTRCDGSADAIRNEETGFVVSPPDAPDSAKEIARALSQMAAPGILERMSQQALALRPRLSMRRHAEEVARIYEEICRSKKTAT
jgi:UDP-glucose:(heptosyl)LPS alpha-1,3-glucosyltransferase